MQFSVKQWRDIRPDSCKACGVAEAIEHVNKTCRLDPRDMTATEELLAASTAVGEFLAALTKAKGKLVKDKDSHKATRELVAEWEVFAKNYQKKLEVKIKEQQRIVGGEIEEEQEVEKARQALVELIGDYRDNNLSKIETAQQRAGEAAEEIRRRNLNQAIQKHGAALNYIKDLNKDVGSTAALKRKILTYANKYNADPRRLENDPELRDLFRHVSHEVQRLRELLDAMEVQIEELSAQAPEQDPTTTNTNPTYRANLKLITAKWKAVVDYAKEGLRRMKHNHGTIAKFKSIVETAPEGAIPKLIDSVRRIHASLDDVFKDVDGHIQENIRVRNQGLNKEADDFGITQEDKAANLMPYTNRAFALNFQCNNIRAEGIEGLSEALELIIERYNSNEARAALDEINAL